MSAVVRRKLPTFFHNSVRHLMLYALGAEVETFLTMCTGVEDLYIFIHGSLDTILPLLESLPLNRFYTPCDSMSPSPLLSFTRLTGLNLGTELGDEEATSAALAALPKLTHLAFDNEGLLLLAHKILSLSRSPTVLIYFAWLTSPWRNKVAHRRHTVCGHGHRHLVGQRRLVGGGSGRHG
ncbi:hypothetical protein B0H14DRAFT_1158370 [Mycena olivaceomarginata]|nr:hypothetical protein B0H14DRAFT_1158370 [Mycena olivaceomarginata]